MKHDLTRLLEPIDIVAGDSPVCCPFDGARTELLEVRDEYSIEKCMECAKLFNVWQRGSDHETYRQPTDPA